MLAAPIKSSNFGLSMHGFRTFLVVGMFIAVPERVRYTSTERSLGTQALSV